MIFGQNVDGLVVAEAEQLIATAGDAFYWSEVEADGVTVMQPTGSAWDKTLTGTLQFDFTIDTAGDYNIFARVDADGQDGKWWVEVDGDPVTVGPPEGKGRLYYRTSSFSWQNGFDNSTINLSVGEHAIVFRSIRDALKVDRVAIVPDGSTVIEVGDTDIGPAHTGTGDAPENAKPYTYTDWMKDPRNNGYRVTLFDIEHSTGITRLATKDWMSDPADGNHPYYGWVTSSFYLERGLSDSKAIGDLEAANPKAKTENWLYNQYEGYSFKAYHGDIRWPKSQFRQIASATNDSIMEIGERLYRFDFIGDIQRFNRTFYTGADVVKDQTVSTAIDWIAAQWAESGAVTYVNLTLAEFNTPVLYTVTESSEMYTAMQAIAQSVGAYIRVDNLGALEVYKPDTEGTPLAVITDDDVVSGSIQMVEVIRAAKKVTIVYNNGASKVSDSTAATTGKLEAEVVIETKLKNLADAQIRLAIEQVNYAKARGVWSADVIRPSKIVHDGAFVEFQHPRLYGSGVITDMRSTQDSAVGTIEVTI